MADSGGSHIAVEVRKYRDNSLQKAPVDGTGELGCSYRVTGATGRSSRGSGSLLDTVEHTVGVGSHGFVMAPSAHLFDLSLAGFSHSDISGEGRQVD